MAAHRRPKACVQGRYTGKTCLIFTNWCKNGRFYFNICFNNAITLLVASACSKGFRLALKRVSTQSPQCMSWKPPVADTAVNEQMHDFKPVHWCVQPRCAMTMPKVGGCASKSRQKLHKQHKANFTWDDVSLCHKGLKVGLKIYRSLSSGVAASVPFTCIIFTRFSCSCS